MNLCFFTSSLSHTGDGKNLISLMMHLTDAGHTVSVILSKEDRTPDGFDFIHKIFPVFMNGNPIYAFYKKCQLIRRIVAENHFDAVLSFGVAANIEMVCTIYGKKVPMILCERDDPNFVPAGPVKKLLRSLCYPLATGFIFQNEVQKGFFPEKIQKKSFVIPNFLTNTAPQCDVSADKTVASYVRLENNQKNLDMMIAAFSLFSKSHPEYFLKIYGEGPYKQVLSDYIQTHNMEWNVKLMGEPDDTLVQLQHAEIFVYTSNFEGMPNPLLTAMQLGMPCVSTNCGGASDLIENGKTGILIDKNDAQTMAEALCYLADSDSVRRALAENAKRYMKFFTPEKIVPLWEEAIKCISDDKFSAGA